MRYLTDVANWWDTQHKESELALDQYVERNPNQFAIIVATAVHTSMVLGSGMVDILRLGDGIVEGTWSGAAQDGIRLVGIVAPVGKTVQLIKSSANLKLARAIVDPGGEICSWIANTKALVQTGFKNNSKVFVAVQDLAKAVGVPFESVGPISLTAMATNLRAIGARVGEFKNVGSMPEVVRLIPHDGSVVVISVKVMKGTVEAGGHAIYAFYDTFGRLRYMDRTGVYSDIRVLAAKYRATEFIPRGAYNLSNIYAKFVAPRGTAILAIEALGLIGDDKMRTSTVNQPLRKNIGARN